MDEMTLVRNRILDSIKVKKISLESEAKKIVDASRLIYNSLRDGGKVVLFGNGGSAADAQHIAGELMGKFKIDRKALPALALTVNTSVLTATANDYSYGYVFERQIEGIGRKGDVAVGISTSGTSENVIKGLKKAKEKGMHTIGLSGEGGGKMKDICDICIEAKSKDTPRIQEFHITVGHIICELVEKHFFEK